MWVPRGSWSCSAPQIRRQWSDAAKYSFTSASNACLFIGTSSTDSGFASRRLLVIGTGPDRGAEDADQDQRLGPAVLDAVIHARLREDGDARLKRQRAVAHLRLAAAGDHVNDLFLPLVPVRPGICPGRERHDAENHVLAAGLLGADELGPDPAREPKPRDLLASDMVHARPP